MDQETRNKLQRATQQARKLLEQEFAEQLEGTFDILPSGKILPEPGKHLDARQKLIRQKLVDAIEHIKAGGKKANEAIEQYTREAAFTFLNRFVALRMLEARDLLQECVTNGDRSSGFKEFCGLTPGLTSLPDGGYQLYLECLFDELSVEVKVLFDRRDTASLLWLRRPALVELLDILGQNDLANTWREDETIGWVYQYFNSGEERKKMREESQAPRNSRELAVRNQFFTPRYVVEFLTDNTLGRIWYEMQKGKTFLVDQCDYMAHRTSEIFLNKDQQPLVDDNEGEQDFSREDLLKKTVYIRHRPKKDPRDLKVLDPACGSGHFLLYAFDLLVTIYQEAWNDEQSPESEITGQRLRTDYPELSILQAAIPSLVLRHNLHGIDIDPRAAQIAALALWMRGQRAYNEFELLRDRRPLITKLNLVCAEPMPGEKELLDAFIEEHLSDSTENRLLGQLVRHVVEAMKLAGEAGSLLKVEEEIAGAIAKAKKQWKSEPKAIQQTLFEIESRVNIQKEFAFDVLGIKDEEFWMQSEQRIYNALNAYAETVAKSDYRRKLFADDATRGFAFIDACSRKYDVVLMNPPFGAEVPSTRSYIRQHLHVSKHDLCAAFVERFLDRLTDRGVLGAITTRTALFVQTFAEWRREIFSKRMFKLVGDLGYGVLDAMVETAMYVIENMPPSDSDLIVFCSALSTTGKEKAIRESLNNGGCNLAVSSQNIFENVPGRPMAYWVLPSLLKIFAKLESYLARGGLIRVGLQSGDDFRFFRLDWEVPLASICSAGLRRNETKRNNPNWVRIAKGGEYSPWWDDIHLVVNWQRHGIEIKRHPSARPQNIEYFFRPGLTYPYRTTSRFGLRVLPSECGFSVGGWGVFSPPGYSLFEVLATYNSRIASYFLEVLLGQGDSSVAGSAARNHGAEAVGGIPFPDSFWSPELDGVCRLLISLWEQLSTDETHTLYTRPRLLRSQSNTFAQAITIAWQDYCRDLAEVGRLSGTLEEAVSNAYRLTPIQRTAIATEEGMHPTEYEKRKVDLTRVQYLFKLPLDKLVESAQSEIGSKRFIVKKAYSIERKVDLICHMSKSHPEPILEALSAIPLIDLPEYSQWTSEVLSYAFGVSIGRWRIENQDHQLPLGDPTASLPSIPMGIISEVASSMGLMVDDFGHELDVCTAIKGSLEHIWEEGHDVFEKEICRINGTSTLRAFIKSGYFDEHIKLYSKSRRKAPIYWQLATPSASYSVWIYYHRFTKDTFFKILNELVRPKLEHERKKMNRLRAESGAEPSRSQRMEVEDQEKFVAELATMAEEVERIAPLWNPNLNDGVIINFAPLWRLVPQNTSWQKECKECWDTLENGDFDWTHLAMRLWPERVVPKCVSDASLAIAHGLEDVFWEHDDKDRFKPKSPPSGGWEATIAAIVKERTSNAVKASLKSLLEAPSARKSSSGKGKKRSMSAAEDDE
ncbi:MAG: BREX-1 system adenine-specific DNA-methyltransferase PglX [Pirellulaceae bacterium]|nr:BREX-1 system adenine-specific DNA-methyltransferase PglX [Pirellulaceae bacterium]